MENNHLGGQNHVPSIWIPFCGQDHKQFHVMCRRAGVDFNYTANRVLALVQALKAMLVGMWMIIDMLEKRVKEKPKPREDDANT
jgi:hypothetical protein